ncbi:MAG TPA: ABC transporter substrate-binding protein [Ramlibacter sp.]|uniref:ABC transporter substrate-binding protein n=1 Tax=Ramlibacter sp. TaxID=1917967 RepID=UPI002B933CAB|nr:ABC transporter substrate-binding protein [Ramlibacter sp.]HVZ42209.1 ABC transporter substrate-binding protein [Ramlibacter sp.]
MRRSIQSGHGFMRAAAVLIAAAALAGASFRAAAEPGVTDKEIVIGMFAPMSGPLVAYGLDPARIAQTLYEEVNQKGGIHGRKIRVVTEDDKCQPNPLVAAVKKLVTVDNVFILHGGSCTAAVTAAQEFITREKVPLVMLAASGDSGVFPPTRYMFGSFMGTQRAHAAGLTEFAAKTLKAKRLGVIVHDDEYGNSSLATIRSAAERFGMEVVAVERIPLNISDVTAPMLNLRAAKPDAILSGGYPAPSVLIVQKYAEFGMSATPIMLMMQGVPTPSVFAKNVGNEAAFRNLYLSWGPNDLGDEALHQKWINLYKSKYTDREPGGFMIVGVPPAQAIIAALEKAGPNLTRERFVEAMESLELNSELMPGPIKFAPGRRDATRHENVVKFDGVKVTRMPGVYSWNGMDGNK